MNSQLRYTCHARTTSELQREFLSDLQRRLDTLDRELKLKTPSAAEASRIARARYELLDLQGFWQQVEIVNEPNLPTNNTSRLGLGAP